MNEAALEEMGPIDYIVIEWPGRIPNGEAMPHLVDALQKLGELKQQGVLTDEEFAAQKAKLLAG